MNFRHSLFVAALLAGASSLAAQDALWSNLDAPAAGDLAVRAVRSEAGAFMLPGVSREPVSFSYALPADQALTATPPHQAASREYWLEVDGAQLRRGVDLFTTAPNALVRVNPAGAAQLGGRAAGLAIDPLAFELRKDNRRFIAGQGMELLATAEQLRAADAPFLEGTSAFRVASALGVGKVQLALPTLQDESERYVVHVFEPQSAFELKMQAASAELLDGQTLEVSAKLSAGRAAVAMSRVETMVVAPSGRAWPIRFVAGADGALRGTLTLDAVAGAGQGLWEVHLVGRGQHEGQTVVRGARTAFAVAVPTAALAGRVASRQSEAGVALEVPVQVGAAGRYEVRGVLYGTDGRGQSRPLAIGHFATWLESGEGRLTLTFERALLDASGLGAPYHLRDLRLMDQSRMGLLHRQANALAIP